VAIDAILARFESIALVTVNAVIEKLRVQVIETIYTGTILLKAIAVVAIFIEVRMHDEVAILARSCVVNVLGIDEFPLNVEGK